MKCIGLIGGMSWKSSAEYYRHINQLVAERLGGLHSGHIILYSLEFDEIVRIHREQRWADAADILTDAGEALKRAGADFLLICTNTMHKVADEVEQGSGLPLLHIADVTAAAVQRQGLKTIGLLGSTFTMTEQFYLSRFEERFGLKVLVPEGKDADLVHRVIFDELCQDRIEPASRQKCVEIINGLVERGAEGIVLGCTELPLLIGPDDVEAILFDTTRLHAEAAVDLALSS